MGDTMDQAQYKKLVSAADRKKMLVAQGALFRSEIIDAKEAARISLHPDSLAKGVFHHLMHTALNTFANRTIPGLAGLDWERILPLAITGVSILSKTPARKKLMRGALVLGVASLVASLVLNRKNISRDKVPDL